MRVSAMVVGSYPDCLHTRYAITSFYARTLCFVFIVHRQMRNVDNKSTVIVVNIQIIPLLFQKSCAKMTVVTRAALLEGATTLRGIHLFLLF